MKRKIGGLVASLVLASIGTFALVSYVQSAKDRALAGEKLVDVLVVRAPIAQGTPATEIAELVATEQVPVKVRAVDGVTSLAAIKDLVAAVDLVPGEQLVAARFVTALAASRQAAVPTDKLQVTVLLEPKRALGGQLRAGDTVGVVASFEGGDAAPGAVAAEGTHLILHKVVVTAVQVEQKLPEPDPDAKANDLAPTLAPTGNLLVTLAVDAPSVERIVFSAERGTLWLSLEPASAPEGGTKVVTSGNVL